VTGRNTVSLLMFALGTALLAAAFVARPAVTATERTGSAGPLRGGTLRVNLSGFDFDYVDPQLSYLTTDWTMLDPTAMLLVGYPEKAGAAGTQLAPIGATSFPTVSKDGKTYTFHVRPGLRFSDGSPVTAAAYQRAFERVLSPKMGSPLGVNVHLQNELVGGIAFLHGKSAHLSGVTARGMTLTVRLVKPDATLVSQTSMEWFTATKPNTPYTSRGLNTFPSAGPYYIATRDPGRVTVLKRNPYYHGPRPANPDEIVFTPNTDFDQSLLQEKAGEADLDLSGVPPTASAALGKQYGVNRGRFWVGPTSCVYYMQMNTSRPPFDKVALRKAANWAIDRPAQVRLLGAYAGKPTDQMLVPGVPGYRPLDVYPLEGADPATARKVGGRAIARAPVINFLHTTGRQATTRAQVAEADLRQAGFQVKDVPTPASTFFAVVGRRNTTYNFTSSGGWCADYFDPFDYINVLFDGRTIQATNNVGYTYFNNAGFNKELDAASLLSGPARAKAYARLDRELVTRYVPVIPYLVANSVYFTAPRVRNWIYSNYLGEPYLNALTVS
jgi:peptide/nickel transport system substrate-binding protein